MKSWQFEVTVLPRKQLLHVLKKEGHKFIGDGWYDTHEGCVSPTVSLPMMALAGESIVVEECRDVIYKGTYYLGRGDSNFSLWKKEWLIPITLPKK